MELSDKDKFDLENCVDPDADNSKSCYDMDEDYQKIILGMVLKDRKFLVDCIDLVKPEYFLSKHHRLICKTVFEYFNEWKTLPNKIILRQNLKDKIPNAAEALACIGELNSLYEFYMPNLDCKEALQDRIVKFAKKQALRIAFNKCVDLLAKGDDKEEVWSQVYECLKVAMQTDKSFDVGLEYFQKLEETFILMNSEQDNMERFSTGFECLDQSLGGGGMSRGEIFAWMGLPGVGKSLALVKAAIANVRRGKKVLYLSLEMDEIKLAQRFHAQLSDIGITELLLQKDVVIKAVLENIKDQIDDRLLIIKQFPAGGADVNTFRSYVSMVKSLGFIPDMIIIDYVGEMKDAPGIPTHESKSRIVRDLRGFATEEKFCCLTAMQPNRSARETQDRLDGFIDDNNLADAFGQIRPLDGLWSINQNLQEKGALVARGFVVKSRNGKSRFAFRIGFDPDTLNMYEISMEKYQIKMHNQQVVDADAVEIDKLHTPTWMPSDGENSKKKKKNDPPDSIKDLIPPK